MALIVTLHSNCNSAVHEIWFEYKRIQCADYFQNVPVQVLCSVSALKGR